MSLSFTSPRELLDTANELMAIGSDELHGLWPRSAAHLIRQALELSLDQFWRVKVPPLAEVSRRAQFICLPEFVCDPLVARRARWTWSVLSEACHHHAYDLSPIATELQHWVEVVEALQAVLVASVDKKHERE